MWCSKCNAFHAGSCPDEDHGSNFDFIPRFMPAELPKVEPPRFDPIVPSEPILPRYEPPRFDPIVPNEPILPRYEPPRFDPIVPSEPILPKVEPPRFDPILPSEPILPRYEPTRFNILDEQTSYYNCGEPGCPGHPAKSGGRCPPTPGPGLGLGPPGNPMTW